MSEKTGRKVDVVMSITVSVVLPYYNTPKSRFDRCIKSVINQTYRDIQIIIVDDGSTKDLADYLDDYRRLDERIIVIHKNNEGAAIARNTGLEEATGEYAMFVDSDDYLFPWAVEDAVKLTENDVDIVIGLVKKFSSDAIGIEDSGRKRPESDSITIESDGDFDILMDHILGYRNKRFEFEEGYMADGPVAKLFQDIFRSGFTIYRRTVLF